MFKKIFPLMMSALIMSGTLTSCDDLTVEKGDGSDKTKIVCTIFPEYDWTKEILGAAADKAELSYLLDKGSDLHNYQPTANDMIKISECDLFVYVGGESDSWVSDALKNSVNKNMKSINLMEIMGDSAKVEEVKEGMMAEEEEEEEEEEEYDEHFWTSLKNAGLFCNEICSALCTIDPENAETYKSNTEQYNKKLENLDNDFNELFASSDNKTLIFADRFPFRYFTDDYDLDYYAAFMGCSAEIDASFETISFLAGKTDELKADTLFVLENSDRVIAKSIIQNTKSKNQNIIELNSMQSVSSDMVKSGTTYLGLMEKNYEELKAVFS